MIILFLLHNKIPLQDSRILLSTFMHFLFSMHIVMLFSKGLLIIYTFSITWQLFPFVLEPQF